MAQLTLSVVPETQGFFSTLAHLGPKDFLKSHFKMSFNDYKYFFQDRFFLYSKVKTIWQKCMALDRGWCQNIMCDGHPCFNMYLLKCFWRCFMLAEFCFAPPIAIFVQKYKIKGTVKMGCASISVSKNDQNRSQCLVRL